MLHLKNLSQVSEADSGYQVWFLMCLWLSSYSFLLSYFNSFVVSIKLIRIISDTTFLHKYIIYILISFKKASIKSFSGKCILVSGIIYMKHCVSAVKAYFFKAWD